MGTNYYVDCKNCGSHHAHIGKQSAGWKFISNIDREEFIRTEIPEGYIIRDEYGREFTKEEFLNKVTEEWKHQGNDYYNPNKWS